MRAVLLVPRRKDKGHRDQLWAWCRDRWERYFPDLDIYEGHHDDGPFNRSAAINRAATEAGDWDLGIVIDSDIFLRVSQVRAAIERATKTGLVTWGHRRWRGFHEDHTKRTVKFERDFGAEVDDTDMDVLIERTTPLSWSCCIVIPRKVWDAMGGFDERFRGWGFEDMAFKSTVTGLYGWERVEGDVYHLWHPRSEERIVKGQPAQTASPEYVVNSRLGRRYMVAVIRDHGVGDQPGEERLDQATRDQHVRNLQRDDARLSAQSAPLRLPDWSKWWPTLEELNAGAREYLVQQRQGIVTVVMHTGGSPDNWPVRRGYLETSLASLSEQVSGPIVQRVIYDCWGDTGIRAELEAMGAPFGFYVSGPGPAVVRSWFGPGQPDWRPFAGSMAEMWGYLGRRALGEFIFQAEDDFTYERPVDLVPMIAALRDNPYLVQMALLRDACYQDEKETGGILGWPEPAFERHDEYLAHKLFWTLNPSLFPRSLTSTRWPVGHHSETLFGKRLFEDKRLRSAFWGDGSEWIRHIGEVRAGVGY